MAVKPPKPGEAQPSRPAEEQAPVGPADEARSARPEQTTPGRLSHDANYHRAAHARRMGFDNTPEFAEMLDGAPTQGASLAELLPSARSHAHPELPEVETRPPPFLSPLAAMKDIYLRVKGRASPKTTELLEGVDLEDLLATLKALFADSDLVGKTEARLKGPLFKQLRDDPGPFLLGFNDPRLTELWRVFLDGWDIWRPEGEDNGVELFWEGEAEDARGRAIEAMQSLVFLNDEAILHTRLGDLEDRLTFDGQAFYRLRPRSA